MHTNTLILFFHYQYSTHRVGSGNGKILGLPVSSVAQIARKSQCHTAGCGGDLRINQQRTEKGNRSKPSSLRIMQVTIHSTTKIPIRPHQPPTHPKKPKINDKLLLPQPITTMPGAGGGAGSGRGGAGRTGGGAIKTAREAAPKGVEKKTAKAPVKAVKEKVVAAKEKAKAKKDSQKVSHDERREAYGLTEKSGDRTAEKAAAKEKRTNRVLRG